MGALVEYRDLPGGPTMLRFDDELTRYCLCANCGMLSMSMLQDKNHHVFCETCLTERSEKHSSDHIYCKYEDKLVDIFEMFEANDLITVIRDQYVVCPNQECATHVTLDQLKDHYMTCQPRVRCPTCGQHIQTAEWENHNKDCDQRGAHGTPPKGTIQKQVWPKDGRFSPRPSLLDQTDSCQNSGATSSSIYPSSELQQAQTQKPTNEGANKKTTCPHCARTVKERNLPIHVMACTKAPSPCVYCDKEFAKETMQTHVSACDKNPDNVRKEAPAMRHQTQRTDVACASHAPGRKKPTYACAAKFGMPEQSTCTGATSYSMSTRPRKTPQVGCLSAKGPSKYSPDSEQDEVPADSGVWLKYLSSGDLLAAFAAFEESFSDQNMDEAALYTQFTTSFVNTKIHEVVKDVLEQPFQKQPLDCLMTALFARASLPRNVWAKGKKVTWIDVSKYLPTVLASRLNKAVMSYLRKYPVFLDEVGTSNVAESICDTKDQPTTTSDSVDSSNPVTPANDVVDPSGKAKDGLDAWDAVVKENHFDGGDSTGEKQPSLPAGEKTLEQSAAKVVVENSEREKRRGDKERQEKDPKTRVKKADAPVRRHIENKESTSDRLEPATDQAWVLTSPFPEQVDLPHPQTYPLQEQVGLLPHQSTRRAGNDQVPRREGCHTARLAARQRYSGFACPQRTVRRYSGLVQKGRKLFPHKWHLRKLAKVFHDCVLAHTSSTGNSRRHTDVTTENPCIRMPPHIFVQEKHVCY